MRIETKGDKIKIIHEQNCTDILRANFEAKQHTDEIWGKSENIKQAANIPMVVFLEWQRLGIMDDEQALLKMLELHPEYKITTKRLI